MYGRSYSEREKSSLGEAMIAKLGKTGKARIVRNEGLNIKDKAKVPYYERMRKRHFRSSYLTKIK